MGDMKYTNNRNARGEMNDEGIYIMAGRDDNTTYIYDFYSQSGTSFGNLEPVKIEHRAKVSSCSLLNENTGICTDLSGKVTKYDFNNNYEKTNIIENTEDDGITPKEEKYYQGLYITKDKKYILVSDSQKLYIYTSDTYELKGNSSISSGGYDIIHMAELRDMIIMTTEAAKVTLRDFRSLSNPIIYTVLEELHVFYGCILPLMYINNQDFAVGGRQEPYGYVELFHLEQNNQSVTKIRPKKWVGDDTTCKITSIKEITSGLLIFGGQRCNHMCTWKYATIDYDSPYCFEGHLGFEPIYDFLPLK